MSQHYELTKRALPSCPKVSVLTALGKCTDRFAGHAFFISPLREEKHPSFLINESANVWTGEPVTRRNKTEKDSENLFSHDRKELVGCSVGAQFQISLKKLFMNKQLFDRLIKRYALLSPLTRREKFEALWQMCEGAEEAMHQPASEQLQKSPMRGRYSTIDTSVKPLSRLFPKTSARKWSLPSGISGFEWAYGYFLLVRLTFLDYLSI